MPYTRNLLVLFPKYFSPKARHEWYQPNPSCSCNVCEKALSTRMRSKSRMAFI